MQKFKKPIGFLANEETSQPARAKVKEDEIFLSLDSGRFITFADATHHLLTLGSTGSGKSQTVIYPALQKLLRAGSFGLIIDIKGNMRGNIRRLAKQCGRENDIIEYGTSPSATPLNMLKGMDRHKLRQFFEQLTIQNFRGASQSIDWHMKGVSVAADCGQLLMFLGEKYPNFPLNCRLIYEMVSDPVEARKLFTFFREKVYDRARPDHKRLVTAVENNRFHALKTVSKFGGSSEATLDENLSWGLHGVRDGLRTFLDAPGVERNFCCPEAQGLDLTAPVKDGKLVVLRFDIDTGPVGASLARMMISDFYARIFEFGLSLPKNKKAFVCIDEFQEVADLSAERFSDSSFVALAREFNCIFMAATQSMSALLSKGADAASVMSFASNCNNKIIFYSDDPMTNEIAARYDRTVNIAELRPGEAFVTAYDQRLRTHEFGHDTLNKSYASVKDILIDGYEETPVQKPVNETNITPLSDYTEWAEKEIKGKATAGNKPLEKDHMESGEFMMPPDIEKLIEKFPDMFNVKEDSEFCVPAGWFAYVENALRAFQATKLQVKITGLRINNGILRACDSGGAKSGAALSLLNSFLEGACGLCVICGKTLLYKDRNRNRSRVGACGGCLEEFGLTLRGAEKEEDDDENDCFKEGDSDDFC